MRPCMGDAAAPVPAGPCGVGDPHGGHPDFKAQLPPGAPGKLQAGRSRGTPRARDSPMSPGLWDVRAAACGRMGPWGWIRSGLQLQETLGSPWTKWVSVQEESGPFSGSVALWWCQSPWLWDIWSILSPLLCNLAKASFYLGAWSQEGALRCPLPFFHRWHWGVALGGHAEDNRVAGTGREDPIAPSSKKAPSSYHLSAPKAGQPQPAWSLALCPQGGFRAHQQLVLVLEEGAGTGPGCVGPHWCRGSVCP